MGRSGRSGRGCREGRHLATVAAPAPAKECLYNRLGGEKPVKTVIGLFYMKAFTDDRIKHWFEGLNKEKMEMKMAGFLKYGFGAETTYKGRDLTTGHADLVARGLCDADYDVVGELFVASLREAGVPEDLVDEIVTILESCRDAVLGRTAAPAAK
ncbi:unnamed protein product [Ostreobium quekettii]|uniref:Group 1 truncated hemoglobin n=1 Tax=Ostreobium quekettii TaxID=121088 RepID=A0A8S1JDT7_9CHLO|nr:unnamed protein product [Ostreobium quekettii]